MNQRAKLGEKSVNNHIKEQLKILAEYKYHKPFGKRDEHQYIYGLKDYFRELMNEKLDDKQNANYKTLKPLLKNMINSIYTKKGVGKHIIQFYEILDYLSILGKNYDDLKDIQNEYYSLTAIKKLDNRLLSKHK